MVSFIQKHYEGGKCKGELFLIFIAKFIEVLAS